MIFENECSCIFDEEILSNAIRNACIRQNKKVHDKYRIFIRNSYPSICIAHNHIYVHRLIGQELYGCLKSEMVIHHIDGNKLNATCDNLAMISKKEHSAVHHEQWGNKDFRSEGGKWRGIKSAMVARYKVEITRELIISLLNQGNSIAEIAQQLNCGVSTVKRRLNGREYATTIQFESD